MALGGGRRCGALWVTYPGATGGVGCHSPGSAHEVHGMAPGRRVRRVFREETPVWVKN